MKRVLIGCLALVLSVIAVPAFAGTVYVPIIDEDAAVTGIDYQTKLWISNQGAVDRRFTSLNLGLDTDGTDRENLADPTTTLVVAESTKVAMVTGAAAQSGLLEMVAAPQLAISARLEAPNSAVLGTPLPVITSDNLTAADGEIFLQPWVTGGNRVTDFYVVNLGHESASCRVDVVRANGSPVFPGAVINFKPVSMRSFVDVLGILGQQSLKDVRARVSCDQDFYAFATTYDLETGEVLVVEAAGTGVSELVVPGTEPPPPPPVTCPTGGACFSIDGLAFMPVGVEPVRRFTFPVPAGTYRKLHMTMDVFHGGWRSPTSGLHNIFWLVRDRNVDMFGYANLRGTGKDTFLFRHGFNIAQENKPKIEQGFRAEPGVTYTFDFTYDAGLRQLTIQIYNRANGALLGTFIDQTNVSQFTFKTGQQLVLDIGFPPGANANEPPTFGWRYENLQIEVTK